MAPAVRPKKRSEMRWLRLGKGTSSILLALGAFGLGFEFGGCASGQEVVPQGILPGEDSGAASIEDAAGGADSTVLAQDSGSPPPATGDDAGSDSEPPFDSDGAADSGSPVTGDDSGTEDSGVQDSGGGIDANGPDAGGTDASSPDASGTDASSPDATAVDAGGDGATSPSFNNPIQISVSSILTIDTVATSGTGGTTVLPIGALTSMDGSGYDFYTAAVATDNAVSGGLPANGLFAASGTQNPVVQLHFDDPSTAANSLLLNGPSPNNAEAFSFSVPAFAYAGLQIYGTSTEGTSTLSVTLTYSDTTTGSTSFTIPDWGTNAASGSVFVLAGDLGRLGSGTYEQNYAFALYGANLSPDGTKSLVSVAVTHTGTGRYVFYGATGW
jgi:hypothetical protein